MLKNYRNCGMQFEFTIYPLRWRLKFEFSKDLWQAYAAQAQIGPFVFYVSIFND